MDIQDLYQELIVDHGTCPRNCCLLADATTTAEGYNPLCGDKIQVYLQLDQQKIEKATFMGAGCAISIASASLMIEGILGKTLPEVLQLSLAFKNLLTTQEEPSNTLGKLSAFSGVKAFPARVKCATLAWHTLEAAIGSLQ